MQSITTLHYSDVIMSAMASIITSLTIVCTTVYSGADEKNIKALRRWSLCGEFTDDRWIPHTKGQWWEICFHLMTSSWYGLPCDIDWLFDYKAKYILTYMLWEEDFPFDMMPCLRRGWFFPTETQSTFNDHFVVISKKFGNLLCVR